MQCAAALAPYAFTREERKVVTVLFADLVGFTARAERLDPEDVRALLTSYHARVRTELERHGGTVEKLIGDGVMALFGAPVAHEDDPERAVRAALTIRDGFAELKQSEPWGELHIRIGVNTGEALVTVTSHGGAGQATPAGDVVNTAARLEAAAPVDGILVGEATYRATERAISYRERPPIEAKGKSEPVAAWEALEPRARFGVDVRPMGRAPLVGRTREVELLVEAFNEVRSAREPELVTIVGSPGLGKSRLVRELFEHIDADPELITWRQGRSLPYGEGVTFWAFAEMVKAQAGIVDTDSSDDAEAKLGRVMEVVAQADRDRIEQFLRPLVGLGGDDEARDRRDETFAAWRHWLVALAVWRPLVLVFEDLHWADDALLDFIERLVDSVRGVPMLVISTSRPELTTRRPDWGRGNWNSTTLVLSPLSDDETARLVHALLERSVLPADLQSALLDRAGGNPLYAEEFARMVEQSTDLDELPLPESLQSLIAARIDGLPQEQKEALQNASVLGKVFWSRTLEALGRSEAEQQAEVLRELERKEFVRREGRSSAGRKTAYAFCHVLVRDVAYGQIPRRARAEKHRLAAEWIESLPRPEDHAESIAHHYACALEFASVAHEDTGALADRARHALWLAGDRSARLNAFPAAARFYGHAVDLWPEDDPGRPPLLARYGHALHFAEGRGQAELAEAVEGLLAQGDRETAAEAEVLLAESAWYGADRAKSNRHLERAAALVAGAQSSRSKARVLGGIARSYMLGGRAQEAIDVGRVALRLAESLGLEELRAQALSYIGGARVRSGDSAGLEDSRLAVEVADAINSPDRSRWMNNYASMQLELGHAREAFTLWDEAAEMAREDGAFAHGRFVAGLRSFMELERGHWDEALELAERFVAESKRSPHYLEGSNYEVRSIVRLARGDPDGAREDADLALVVARRAEDPQAVGPLLAHRAALLVELGDVDAANADVDEIVGMFGPDTFPLSPVAVVAVVFESLGRREDLERMRDSMNPTRWRDALDCHLTGDTAAAADICEEIGMLLAAARWRLLGGSVLAERGHQAEADLQLEKALAFFDSVGAPRYARQAESLLSATA